MITILPQPIRFELTCLFAELQALKSAARYARPLSPHTLKESVGRALECLTDLEACLVDYLEGCVDEDGEIWNPDDRVVLVDQLAEVKS